MSSSMASSFRHLLFSMTLVTLASLSPNSTDFRFIASFPSFSSQVWAQTPSSNEPTVDSKTVEKVTDKSVAQSAVDEPDLSAAVVQSPNQAMEKKAEKKTLKPKKKTKKGFWEKILPILLLLMVVAIILSRLPTPNFEGQDISWRSKAFSIPVVFELPPAPGLS